MKLKTRILSDAACRVMQRKRRLSSFIVFLSRSNLQQSVRKMNTRFRTNLQKMKAPHHDKEEKIEDVRSKKTGKNAGSYTTRCKSNTERKIALIQDVDKLKKRLRHEENIHKALERAITRPLGALPRFPPYLPPQTLELLAEVAVLEEEVVWLEEQVVNFRQGLYQEAAFVPSKRNMENSIELVESVQTKSMKHRRTKSMSQNEFNSETFTARFQPSLTRTASIRKLLFVDSVADQTSNGVSKHVLRKQDSRKSNYCSSSTEEEQGRENQSCSNSIKEKEKKCIKTTPLKKSPIKTQELDCRLMQGEQTHDCSYGLSDEPVSRISQNNISEDLGKCLSSIYTMTSKSNHRTVQSETCHEYLLDSSITFSNFKHKEVGPCKNLQYLEACSVDRNGTANSFALIRQLKYLLGKLATLNFEGLNNKQKLAFWINIYNSGILNDSAFGVESSRSRA